MKLLLMTALCCGIAVFAHAQNADKIIRTYFSGYEKKDWNIVSSQLAEGFTFTSPAPDDHIPRRCTKPGAGPSPNSSKRLSSLKLSRTIKVHSLSTTSQPPTINTYATQNIIPLATMAK